MDKKTTKVLICDDSILARKSLRALLEASGFENILEVSDGQACVDICEKEKPQIVFLDIVMPVKDGVTATAEIKETSPDTIIIIVSSVGTQTHLKEALKAGAKDFIQKPLDEDLFNQIISNLDFD